MSGTATMTFRDGHDREVTREVNQVLNVRDFLGTPGYALLVVAANTHLSLSDIERLLELQAQKTPGVARSRSWIQRRRWLFQQPDAVNAIGRTNRDGKDARALAIMADNPTMSSRKLVALLKEHGISRNREWTRKHRCEAIAGDWAATHLPI